MTIQLDNPDNDATQDELNRIARDLGVPTVTDNLQSTDASSALSANQGRALRVLIETHGGGSSVVIANNLTTNDPTQVLSAAQGVVLKAAVDAAGSSTGGVPVTRTVNGHALSSDVTVSKSDVGLANADNTADASKPVSTAQASAIASAVAAVPTTPVVDSLTSTSTTSALSANQGSVIKGITDGLTTSVGTAQSTANSAGTLAASKADATATTTALALKAPLASPTFTGTPAAPTATAGTSTTQLATTAFVGAAVASVVASAYTWAAKPAASSLATGTEIIITDVGTPRSRWYTDGTNWRPVNGRVLLKQFGGSVASPAIVYSGTGNVQLAQPGGNLKLPGGMLLQGSSIVIEGMLRKRNNNAGTNVSYRIGTVGTFGTGSNVLSATFSGDGQLNTTDFRVVVSTSTVLSSTMYSTRNSLGGSYQDFSTNIDTTADMFFTLEIGTATNAGDFLDVISHSVSLMQ